MNINKYFLFGMVLLCVSIISLSGCAGVQKMPIKLDPNFNAKGIDTIVLMQIVDRRIDKKANIDLEKEIRIPTKKILEKKGYTVVMPDTFGEGMNVSANDVGEMGVEDLATLGPKDSKVLLFIYLEDVSESYIVLAYTFKIEATGSLIHKQEKIELWRDKGIGACGQGGLISGVFSGVDRAAAIEGCRDSMLVTLPKVAKAEQRPGKSDLGNISSQSRQTMPADVVKPAI